MTEETRVKIQYVGGRHDEAVGYRQGKMLPREKLHEAIDRALSTGFNAFVQQSKDGMVLFIGDKEFVQ